ncbi:uncharacterized protein LOC111497207 [Cucurbita maxima]|uniref:Uncharacterized protein LOC111497207 n=1 Tax=Cucurbita maxima TaxID=3661 RepID=A0A6J1KPY8_CUCMA|nr:uncharacterized protein LOC111497207 [Cucurbita maxima]
MQLKLVCPLCRGKILGSTQGRSVLLFVHQKSTENDSIIGDDLSDKGTWEIFLAHYKHHLERIGLMGIVFCPLMMGAGSQFFSLFEFLDLNPVEGAAVGLMYLELESNQVIGGESYDWEIGSSSRDEDNDPSDDGSGSSRHQDRRLFLAAFIMCSLILDQFWFESCNLLDLQSFNLFLTFNKITLFSQEMVNSTWTIHLLCQLLGYPASKKQTQKEILVLMVDIME